MRIKCGELGRYARTTESVRLYNVEGVKVANMADLQKEN